MGAFSERWEAVQERVVRACARTGSDPDRVQIVAVSKTRSAAEVQEAVEAGVRLLGENRVQEAASKRPQVISPARWHMIGHLQRNKAAKAVQVFDMVQSVDDARLAAALDRHAGSRGRTLDVLIQVNTTGAVQQSGVSPEDTEALVASLRELANLRLRGLMTIGPLSSDEGEVRSRFAALRELRDGLVGASGGELELPILSMGMSGDFEWALAEGSNMLRLGTVLFGPRVT